MDGLYGEKWVISESLSCNKSIRHWSYVEIIDSFGIMRLLNKGRLLTWFRNLFSEIETVQLEIGPKITPCGPALFSIWSIKTNLIVKNYSYYTATVKPKTYSLAS